MKQSQKDPKQNKTIHKNAKTTNMKKERLNGDSQQF